MSEYSDAVIAFFNKFSLTPYLYTVITSLPVVYSPISVYLTDRSIRTVYRPIVYRNLTSIVTPYGCMMIYQHCFNYV